jgi:hypothetical protein
MMMMRRRRRRMKMRRMRTRGSLQKNSHGPLPHLTLVTLDFSCSAYPAARREATITGLACNQIDEGPLFSFCGSSTQSEDRATGALA